MYSASFSLLQLAQRSNVAGGNNKLLERLSALPPPRAIEESLEEDNCGLSALHHCCFWDAPLEVIQAVCDVARSDPQKRNPASRPSAAAASLPLHLCAIASTHSSVLQFVIDKFPHALVRKNNAGLTPLFYAQCITYRANSDEIVRCLEDNTARYPALLNQITSVAWSG